MTKARTTSRRRQALHHHAQDQRQANPHHPQAPQPASLGPGEGDCGCRLQRRDQACCEHDHHEAVMQRCGVHREIDVPPPQALRPLARALLSVAADVHAERREVRHVTGSAHETTLRMENGGLRHPVRSGILSGVLPPATPERTPSESASSHVDAASPPPVENSDCIGDWA